VTRKAPSGIELAERGLLPDAAIRLGIRRMLHARLESEARGGVDASSARKRALLAEYAEAPIAVETAAANRQHYEVPAELFRTVLGKHLKYSSGYWPAGVDTLDAAETAMLELYAERAGLADGMRVLDLGSGWGSFSLWLAARHPKTKILAVSSSSSQADFVRAQAKERGLSGLDVVVSDVNAFEPSQRFDRVLCIEMLEHVRNHRALFRRIADWLAPNGRLFVHVFCHREYAYPFEIQADDDWMGRHFFTGGLMPSEDWLLHFQDALTLRDRWTLDGRHYGRTARAWLANLDANRGKVLALFRDVYGADEAERWLGRWRIFFLACEELWDFRAGSEWRVAHYLWDKK
jgi:cyclopropane-fatty-acyl-phospholipid synthase